MKDVDLSDIFVFSNPLLSGQTLTVCCRQSLVMRSFVCKKKKEYKSYPTVHCGLIHGPSPWQSSPVKNIRPHNSFPFLQQRFFPLRKQWLATIQEDGKGAPLTTRAHFPTENPKRMMESTDLMISCWKFGNRDYHSSRKSQFLAFVLH